MCRVEEGLNKPDEELRASWAVRCPVCQCWSCWRGPLGLLGHAGAGSIGEEGLSQV